MLLSLPNLVTDIRRDYNNEIIISVAKGRAGYIVYQSREKRTKGFFCKQKNKYVAGKFDIPGTNNFHNVTFGPMCQSIVDHDPI